MANEEAKLLISKIIMLVSVLSHLKALTIKEEFHFGGIATCFFSGMEPRNISIVIRRFPLTCGNCAIQCDNKKMHRRPGLRFLGMVKTFAGSRCFSTFVPRIGLRRTRTQQSGTQSAAADGTRTRWLFEPRHCRSWIEAIRWNLRTDGPDSYTRSLRVRVRVPRC